MFGGTRAESAATRQVKCVVVFAIAVATYILMQPASGNIVTILYLKRHARTVNYQEGHTLSTNLLANHQTVKYEEGHTLATNILTVIRPARILDLGGMKGGEVAYFSPIVRVLNSTFGWCLEVVLSVDAIYNGSSHGTKCGNSGRQSAVIYAPTSVASDLQDPRLMSVHFDAIVCVGCDEHDGPSLHQMEGFVKPYHLVLEAATNHFTSIPTVDDAELVYQKDWEKALPLKSPGYDSLDARRLQLVYYANPRSPRSPSTPVAHCNTSYPVDATHLKCEFPYAADASLEHPWHATYEDLAHVAEQVYTCKGMRASGWRHFAKTQCQASPSRTCTMNLGLQMYPYDKVWQNDSKRKKQMTDNIQRCLGVDLQAISGDTALCNEMSVCTAAWHAMNAYRGDFRQLPGPLVSVVRKHSQALSAFTRGLSAESPKCKTFPKPDALCSGMQQYPGVVSELEKLYPDSRNMMYHEQGELIAFTPYLPLPAVPSFDHRILKKGRKILITAGGNDFYRAAKHFIDLYSPYFQFDQVYVFDPDPEKVAIPEEYNHNISFMQMFLKVGSRREDDLVSFLNLHTHVDDFVVLMFDVDRGPFGPSMEWGFLADLTSQRRPLVDELYIELHFKNPKIGWRHQDHTCVEAYDLLLQLRENCNFAVHAWP